jgi:hypothetical protein
MKRVDVSSMLGQVPLADYASAFEDNLLTLIKLRKVALVVR